MNKRISIVALVALVLGTIFAPASLADTTKTGKQDQMACFWAKWYLDERDFESDDPLFYRPSHRRYWQTSTTIREDDIPPAPPMKTVEQYMGNRKVTTVIPEAQDETVRIQMFDSGRLNQFELKAEPEQ